MNDTIHRTFPINVEANYTLVDDADLNFESFDMNSLNINSNVKDFVQQNSTFSFYSLIFLILIIIMIVILRFFTRKFPINFNSEIERKNTKRMNDFQFSFIFIYYIIAFVFYVYTAANLTVTWQKITFAGYSVALVILLIVYFSIKMDQHRKYIQIMKMKDNTGQKQQALKKTQIQIKTPQLAPKKQQNINEQAQTIQTIIDTESKLLQTTLKDKNAALKQALQKNKKKLDTLQRIQSQKRNLQTEMAKIQADKALQKARIAKQQAQKAQQQARLQSEVSQS